MDEVGSYSKEQSLYLLNQLHHMLQSHSLIDEVGFIHTSQFVVLDGEAGGSSKFHSSEYEFDDMVFWNRDNKLGISTLALFPLHKAAKHTFMETVVQYKMTSSRDDDMACSLSEINVMKHSKTLLLLSSDFGTAWNYRKLIVSKKQQLQLYMDELLLSSLVLSYSPKSDHAWSHRRWVIKMIAGKCSNLQDIVGKESELVKVIAERSKMNYHAWNHRCWLVTYMGGDLVRHELEESRGWSALHVADNCCFHYCRRLLLRILDDMYHKQDPNPMCSDAGIHQLWKEELEWNKPLLKRFIGRESLWLHRRFLSLYWLNQLACKTSISYDISIFVDNEIQLLTSCLTIPDNEFGDVEAQALYSATYILWLAEYVSDSGWATLKDKLMPIDLKKVLTIVCPEKTKQWDVLSVLNRTSSLLSCIRN